MREKDSCSKRASCCLNRSWIKISVGWDLVLMRTRCSNGTILVDLDVSLFCSLRGSQLLCLEDILG